MSVRSVIVRLEAEVAGFVSGMGRANEATDNVVRNLRNATNSTTANREAMGQAGKVMAAFGAATMTGLGASAKAAMDWESAWAGVTKTVDGTPEQMNELEASLRGLAKTLPATHTEIAGVAEAAGQLGVAREDVAGFTKTMIDLGVSTNLTAEDAATNIAQISNVMGTMAREGSKGVERFGATLVALGNDGASTEAQILAMAQRIAGAAATVGASEVDVLALSNALASMGIQAELGGGVTTRVLLKMYSAVKEGGPKLDAFARAAGTSAEQFAKAFGESPVRAMDMVNKGLGRIKDEGGNVVSVMSDMGIKGTQETQVMLALAASGNLLSDSLALGAKSWEENTALVAEATKRYETTDSKVKIAWNNIKDAAIDAGAVLLPIIQGVAESVSGLAQTFGSLPGPVKSAVTIVAGVVGAAALAGGALLGLTPKILETRAAFRTLNAAGSSIPAMFGKVAKGAGIALGAVIAFEAAKGIYNALQPATQSVEQFTQALVGLGKTQGSIDQMFKNIGFDDFSGKITTAGGALAKLVNQDFRTAVASFGATNLGINNGMAQLADGVKKADQAIAGAASSGNLEMAAKGFQSIAKSAEGQGVKLEETAKRFPLYMDSLRALASDNKVALTEQELLNWAMGKTPAAMEQAMNATKGAGESSKNAAAASKELTDALDAVGVSADGTVFNLDKFTEALMRAGLLNLSARDAARNYQETLDAVSASIAANGISMDINTEQGRKNQAALDAIAGAGFKVVEANAKNGESQEVLQGNLQGTYDDLIRGAGQFGITGQAAIDLAREILKVPDGVSIDSWMADSAKRMAGETKAALDNIPKQVTISVDTYKTTFEKLVGLPASNAPPASIARPPGLAGGGDLDSAPGPKGVDSQLFLGARGEHVFTAQEVDAMGGQQAVYRFRADVRAGNFQHLAGGGTVGTLATARDLTRFVPVVTTGAGGGTFEGNLYLDSGEFLGRVRGIAQQEASSAVGAAGRDIGRGRSV